jgi:uncharacterized coiled-coil DUF342 family protein
MSANPRKLVETQIQRVRRRLWMRALLESLVGFWALGLLVCAAWFMVRPFVMSSAADWARLGIPAGIMVAATLTALVWSLLRAPQFVTASLALDEEFGLKERVTTFTTLPPDQVNSPAGQALLEDVRDKVANLDVPSRFPVRLRWSAGLMPVLAGVLALGASFFDPSLGSATNRPAPKQNAVIDPKEIQLQLENLRKVVKKENDGEDLLKSKELEELEKEWQKLVNKPLDPNNKEQVRERTNELAKLDEKIQKRVNDLKDKSSDLKKHLDRMQLDKLGKKLQDGPAKDLEDALAKGKFDKAREVLEKLQKDLENNKLNKEELKKLGEQMKELQDKLKRLVDQKERKDQLQKDFDEGKITKEQLDREMENLKQQAQELQDLEELAEMLGECKECLGAGDSLKAGKRIKGALEKLKAMELTDAEMRRLLSDQSILKGALDGMCEACNGDMDANGNKNGLGKGRRPGGVRPVGEEPDSKNVDTREKGIPDPTGQQFITGFTRGGTFKKIPSAEVSGAFKRADQDSSEAIERQRIPTEAEAQVRGYFQKLGRQKD